MPSVRLRRCSAVALWLCTLYIVLLQWDKGNQRRLRASVVCGFYVPRKCRQGERERTDKGSSENADYYYRWFSFSCLIYCDLLCTYVPELFAVVCVEQGVILCHWHVGQRLPASLPEPHRASPRSPARDPQTSPVGVHAVQDDYLTRDQLRKMITGANIAIDDNIEGLLDRIFQEMDSNGTGHVGRRDLWQKLDKFLPSGEEDEVGAAGPRSLQPRMPSPPPPAPLPERRHESPRSASGYPLGSQAWELLHRIYSRLAGQDAKVPTASLIEEIRHDVHVRSERLLERPVVGIGFGQGPSISLDAALQHVLRQVAGEAFTKKHVTYSNAWLVSDFLMLVLLPRSHSPCNKYRVVPSLGVAGR